MAVNIVTGMTGIEHITSHDDRARNASQFGRGKYVFDVGNKFSATAVDDNLVRIQDGMCINQGTQMGIEPNDYADVEIDNGLLGTNRHDIIVMRYEKNEETLLEKASLAVVKGVNSSEPVDPDITEGNILDGGDLVDDMPLYRVVIEGVNLVSVEPLFEVFDGDVGSILEELNNKVDKVTGKGLSTNDYTNADKTKLNNIETGAEVNVQADWSQNDNTADDFIKHKPGIPSKTSDLQNDSDFVSDANYVHTDNNYTNADKEDVAKIDTLETNQTQILSDIEDLEHSLSTTSTATGNPISISDSAHVNAEELTVELEPIQDLHGYDKPWAGGAGKNKLKVTTTTQTVNGVTFTVNDDGTITANGTVGTNANINLTIGEFLVDSNSCIVNGVSGGSANTYYLQIVNEEETTQIGVIMDGDNTIPISANTKYKARIRILSGVTVNNLVFKPMIRLATETDPTFEPYTNICPISGYTEVSVQRDGVNQWDIDNSQNGYINENGEVTSHDYFKASSYIMVSPNDNYTLSYYRESNPSYREQGMRVAWYDANKNFIQRDGVLEETTSGLKAYTCVSPSNAYYARVSCPFRTSNFYNQQFELGSTATSYEPCTADTYTLQFGDTVYGAEVDFVSGVATVTKGYIEEYAGETLSSTWISDRDVYASGTTPTTGAQVVYELATPYTIQLTPQQIKLLKGNNVLVADGDMELTYQTDSVVGDVKEWAEEEFLPKNSATAQHNYSTQEQVVGTWIDGSALYEKTLKWTGNIMLSDSAWTTIPFSEIPSNMDYVQAVLFVTDCVYDNRTRIKYENNLLKAATSQSYGQNISSIVITIQYTKTTD